MQKRNLKKKGKTIYSNKRGGGCVLENIEIMQKKMTEITGIRQFPRPLQENLKKKMRGRTVILTDMGAGTTVKVYLFILTHVVFLENEKGGG